MLAPLRGKDVRAIGVTSTMVKILKEGTPGLIEQVDIAEFAAFVSDV
jgi:hypothetical protein